MTEQEYINVSDKAKVDAALAVMTGICLANMPTDKHRQLLSTATKALSELLEMYYAKIKLK